MSEEQITTDTKRKGKRPTTDTLPMDEAPCDGKAVWLYDKDMTRLQATWHNTRRYSAMSRTWENTGFWVKRNTGGVPVHFEPIGWSYIKGWADEI
jgi:hypothetical protein